ncbi:ABC transporter substrate-binding protein [Domibacillus enclensis]|uniref:Carbohydrate ABC transporter substrate-binding protein, CUT1 family n=1 Tax=Domibacillus enclensis TaxID=1017273 RepID=A0A1N7C2Z5_9BACI|nr:sugar ABC transporter substrate-binding protein [Domibacillus enclensis]OXS74213.1 hypothetical protein B1B05_17210 [Domibacillus enclensis]SIR57813.1 carbohydrate ABC transporter substrate-binding protein, CUT1 family [Domibacillus enclensis]
MKSAHSSKTILLRLALVFVLILTAGCGSNTETGNETSKTVLKVSLLPFIEPESLEMLVSEFNSSQDSIEVDLTMLGWSDGREQIKTAVTSGTGPDVFYLGALDEAYIEADALASAEELGFEEDSINAFNPLIESYKDNNQILAFPLGYEMNMLFYRKDILAEQGFDNPPATWEELYTTAKAISDSTLADGESDIMGLQINGMDEHLNALNLSWGSMLAAAGGQYIKDGESSLNSPEGQEALSFMKRFYDEKISIPGLSAVNGFSNGEIAMFYFTQPTADQQNWYDDADMKDKWGMAPMPKGPESAAGYFAAHTVAVNSRSENVEAAGEFVRWLASPERTSIFMESAHYISPFDLENVDPAIQTKIDEITSKDPEVWEALNQQMENNIDAGASDLLIQSRNGYTERWSAQPSHLVPAITGEISIEDALENIDTQVDQAINY